MKGYFKLTDKYNLICHQIENPKTVDVPDNKELVFVIDRSYSMYYELPALKEQLKNEIALRLKPNDNISIIYFSSNGDCGTILNRYTITNVNDFNRVKDSIDKWLVPHGSTGFVDPLKLCKTITDKATLPVSVFFMSDGWENNNSEKEILACADVLQHNINSAVVIEYGDYCNHSLMVKIAEQLGAEWIYSKNFSDYEVKVRDFLLKGATTTKKVSVPVKNAINDFVFTSESNTIYKIKDGVALIPEGIGEIYYISNDVVSDSAVFKSENEQYHILISAAYHYNNKMQPDIVYAILSVVGDIYLIQEKTNAIGTQANNRFSNLLNDVINNTHPRFLKGKEVGYLPKDDSFSLFDLLMTLSNDPDNTFFQPENYSRIGKKKVQRNSVLTESDKLILDELKDKNDLVGLKDFLSKKEELKFKINKGELTKFQNNLVLNNSRANLSIRSTVHGIVDLSNRADKPQNIPSVFPTFSFRNYTILKDGRLNIDELHVRITVDTYEILLREGVEMENPSLVDDMYDTIIRLDTLPIVNRNMLKTFSSEQLLDLVYYNIKSKADAKVIKHFRTQIAPDKSETFIKLYGEDSTNWLDSIGISEKGFAPQMVDDQDESMDSYIAPELEIKIEKLGSASKPTLPSINNVLSKIEKVNLFNEGKGKKASYTLSESIMADTTIKIAEIIKNSNAIDDLILIEKLKIKESHDANIKLAGLVTGLLLSQKWFSDVEPDQNVFQKTFNDLDLKLTVNINEVTVKL